MQGGSRMGIDANHEGNDARPLPRPGPAAMSAPPPKSSAGLLLGMLAVVTLTVFSFPTLLRVAGPAGCFILGALYLLGALWLWGGGGPRRLYAMGAFVSGLALAL